MNFSTKGTYLNMGVPGTGLSYREKISGPERQDRIPQPVVDPGTPILIRSQETDNILTFDVQEVTSQDMQGIKESIIWAHQQRNELRRDVSKVKTSLLFGKAKLFLSHLVLLNKINKPVFERLKDDVRAQKETISVLKQGIEGSLMNLEIDFEENIKDRYMHAAHFYRKLCNAEKIWDITGSYYQDRVATRSAASTAVKKTEVQIDSRNLDEISCTYLAFHFKNANGGDIYIYPDFIIMFRSIQEFAVIGFNEIDIQFKPCQFLEETKVPSDSKVIGHTWAKVNKNGSPDKRFKDNYQIPIALYGELTFKTKTGLHEAYQFSNYEDSRDFHNTLVEYQQTLNGLKRIKPN